MLEGRWRASSGDQAKQKAGFARAEALGDDLEAIGGTSLDKGVELDARAYSACDWRWRPLRFAHRFSA